MSRNNYSFIKRQKELAKKKKKEEKKQRRLEKKNNQTESDSEIIVDKVELDQGDVE